MQKFTNFARLASVTGAQTRHALRDPRPNSATPFGVFHSQAPRLLPAAPPQKTGRAPFLCRSNAQCESQDEIRNGLLVSPARSLAIAPKNSGIMRNDEK